jgi:hypothetical protein
MIRGGLSKHKDECAEINALYLKATTKNLHNISKREV